MLLAAAVLAAALAGPPLPAAAAPAAGHPLRVDAALIVGSSVADLVATEDCIHRGACYEGNPLMRSTAARVAVKAATATAAVLVCRELRRHGHPGKARGAAIGVAVFYGLLAAQAVRLGR